MVQLRHPARVLLLLFLGLSLALPALLSAQGDSRYKNPPALVGRDGKVVIGIARGVIYKSSVTATGSMSLEDSLTPGNGLPAELHGVWHFTMPSPETDPDLIYGLVSYTTGTDPDIDTSFGFLKSNDFGATWELKKPAAMADTQFRVTTNFWLQGLAEMFWLPDGLHGWAYGKRGIVRTTDGGETWEVMYKVPLIGNQQGQPPETYQTGVWALCFKSVDSGAAAIGPAIDERFQYTTDGGRTWSAAVSGLSGQLNTWRVTQIDYVAGKYWAWAFDRFKLDGSLSHKEFYSSDGRSWESFKVGQILREPTHMDEVLWAGVNQAFMILRSGDIWKSKDPRVLKPLNPDNPVSQWTKIQAADSSQTGYPISTNIGWGQTSILIKDQTGRDVIVHASTLRNDGDIYRLYQWLVEVSASAPNADRASNIVGLSVYPNPTPGVCQTRFLLAKGGDVRVSVLNLLGEEIYHGDLGRLNEGEHLAPVDLSGAPAGVYTYIVSVDGRRESTSFVITD